MKEELDFDMRVGAFSFFGQAELCLAKQTSGWHQSINDNERSMTLAKKQSFVWILCIILHRDYSKAGISSVVSFKITATKHQQGLMAFTLGIEVVFTA